jgi:hypothetical protein
MIKKKTEGVSITYRSFPQQNVPFEVQSSTDYGLQVGEAIQYEWFSRSARSCKYFEQRDEFHNRRMYANGTQGLSKYKEKFAVNGDMSYLNLDWKVIPVIPKYVDILANGMAQREFQIKATSVDPTSIKERADKKRALERDMVGKDMAIDIKNKLGIDVTSVPIDKIPGSKEELDIQMELEYKPPIEIAEEVAIESIFKFNDYDKTIRRKVEKDLIEVGVGFAKHRFTPTDGVKLEYVDPANLIWSYTEDPYFQDCFYFGEYKNVNLSEVYKEYPNLTNEQKQRLQSISNSWNNYYELNYDSQNTDVLDGKIGLLYFNYKTSRERVWKKKKNSKGGLKVIPKGNDFVYKGTGDADFEKLTKIEEVWFEGVLVLGTSIMLQWEVVKNMVKSKSNLNKVLPNYIGVAPKMYRGYIDSTVNRMIPFADDIQMSWLKLQQIKQRVVPDGQYIDVDGLVGIKLGNGNKYTVEDALNMYFQTGSVIGRSSNVGGEFNNAKVPIQEIRHSSGQDKINSLWNSIQISMDMIASVTGINQAIDASNPDKNSLVGIQKMAAYSSNVATRHILEGSMFVTRELAKCIAIRVSDILEYSEMKDDLINKISSNNVDVLKTIKDSYLHDFAINIDLVPDEEERAKLEADISLEIQQGNLGVEDKYAILGIKNMKLAGKYLAVRKDKKMKERQESEMQKVQAQTQSNIQSAQAASESKAQLIQLEGQSKAMVEQTRVQAEMEKMQMEAQLKLQLMEREFQYQMQIKGIEVEGMKSKETMKEDRKDERTKLQATQQSKMIEQRKKDMSSINFESSEDGLDGFSLGQFEPR